MGCNRALLISGLKLASYIDFLSLFGKQSLAKLLMRAC